MLVLALAMNFEPSRPVWVPLMLARPRPILQLNALFWGSFLSGLGIGLLVLFAFEKTPFSGHTANAAVMQILVGLAGLLIAAILASNFSFWRGRSDAPGTPETGRPQQTPVDKMSDRARAILKKGNSPWLSAAIGVAIGAPSLEFLAALVVIASSGAGQLAEVAALVMFLLVGNALITIPLTTYFLTPLRTGKSLERLQNWLRTRGRREFAAILAVIGCTQLVIGLIRL